MKKTTGIARILQWGKGLIMTSHLTVRCIQERIKPFENVSCQGVCRIFFREGAPIFVTFSSVVFSADLILSNLRTKNDFRGIRGHAYQKIFENLHTAMAILVLFSTIFKESLSTFLAANFECFTDDAFCSHSVCYAC